jgi:hypothetical protein
MTMSTRRAVVALISVVICGTWPLAGCGENSDPVRVPAAWAHPPDPVPCPERPRSDSSSRLGQRGSFDARTLIGMAERDANALALEHGCTMRVAARDGEGYALSADERIDRVDVHVEDGHVVGVNDS